MKKKELGQFYTKNYKYILQNISIPEAAVIIEPFAGEGDLIKYAAAQAAHGAVEAYDIDPKKENIIQRDTLLNPPIYKNKFVITNPPYRARNKSADKEIYDRYKVNDLYKCFIVSILNDKCKGGIIIIPLNFLCSMRKNDILLRKRFLSVYQIQQINIFEEAVFQDTTAAVCSLLFHSVPTEDQTNIDIYPSKFNIKIKLDKQNNYTIGGDWNLSQNEKYSFKRLTKKNIKEKNTNILVKCIDDGDGIGLLGASEGVFIDDTPNSSARSYLTLIINPPISETKQRKLINDFNDYLKMRRRKYNSLFLTNYRESARKRISFDLVYKIMSHLI